MLENAKKFIISRTKPLLFAINRYGLVVFFRFWMAVVKKADGKESGEAAGFSGGKTKIVQFRTH